MTLNAGPTELGQKSEDTQSVVTLLLTVQRTFVDDPAVRQYFNAIFPSFESLKLSYSF